MWASTREAHLTQLADDHAENDHNIMLLIDVLLVAQQQRIGVPVHLQLSQDQAWLAIRSLIRREQITAEGKSLERRGIGASIETRFPNRQIPSGDADSLIIISGIPGIEPKDALGPNEMYRFNNFQGCYWYDVRLRAVDIFRVFPAESDQVKPAELTLTHDRSKSRLGRRKGSGSLARFDEPLLRKMKDLIDQGTAVSAEGASSLLAHEAKGGGSRESKAERLAKRFRASEHYDRNKSD
jgi:hypothetical protein